MAIYVQVTGGSHQSQSRWSGSNVDVKFDGTAVTLSASAVGPTCNNGAQPQADGTCADGSDPGTGAVSAAWTALAAANVRWTLLDAPEGTIYDGTWFSSNNGGPASDTPVSGVNPLVSGNNFKPDKEGSWFFLVENTATSESIYFVVSVMSDKTGIRIPAAGETNQADQDKWNRVYATMKDQGWAKDRNYALTVLNDLATAGGLQVCYFDDAAAIAGAPWSGALKAGAAVAIKESDPTWTHPKTGEHFPKVVLADGNTEYKYLGVVNHGWKRPLQDEPAGAPFQPNTVRRWPKVKTTTEIPNGSLVVVSRAGFVECASGINPTDPASGFVAGQILYLSATPGILQAGSDRFALGASKTTYVVPACLLLRPSATLSKIVTLPHDYLGGISAATKDQSFRFVGVGDFRGLRVGSTDAAAVAGESAGVIEVVGTNSSGGTLTAGTVVSIMTNPVGAPLVYKADSGATNANQWSGTIGVTIENVANTATGHFAVFGSIVATNYGAPTDKSVYVGSSRHSAGDQSGKIVALKEVSGNKSSDDAPDKIVPVGSTNAAGQLMLGWHKEHGLIDTLRGGISDQTTNAVRGLTAYNKSNITIKDATVDLTDEDTKASVKIAGSGADDSLADVTMFECKISGSQLWQTTTATATTVAAIDAGTMGGAPLKGPAARAVIPLYGTFCMDGRLSWYNTGATTSDLFSGVDSPLTLRVYATVPVDYNVSKILLQASVRFNSVSMRTGSAPTHYPSTFDANNNVFWPVYKNVIPAQLVEDYSDSTTSANYKTVCWTISLVDYSTLPSTMLTDGSTAIGSKYIGSALDKFGAPNVDASADFYWNSLGRRWRSNLGSNRSANTADVMIYRTDTDTSTDAAVADNIIVTQVSLESAKHKMIRGKRGRYEAAIPGTSILTNNATLLDIKKHDLAGAWLNAVNNPKYNNVLSTMVGTAVSGATTNNVCYAFFTRDKRASPLQSAVGALQDVSSLTLKVFGKFACPNVGSDNLTLQAYVKEVKASDVLNVDIASAAPAVTGSSVWNPVQCNVTGAGPAAPSVSNSYNSWEVPAPTNDSVVGWWVKITRTGVTNINAQEVFFIITNIQLESDFDSSKRSNYRNANSYVPYYYRNSKDSSGVLDVPDDVYEHHVHPVEMFRPGVTAAEVAANKFVRSTDITGYGPLQNTGGSPFTTAIWTSALDYRYDDKSGLLVDVITAVTSSGGTVDYQLYVKYEDCFNSAPAGTTNRYYVGKIAVDNTAAIAAASARYLKHQFVVPPDALWDTVDGINFYDNPDYTDGRNKGIARFELIRSDTQAYNAIIVGAVVQSPHGNKTKLGEIFPININERTNIPSAIGSDSGAPNPVYVPGYTSSDSYRSINLSIQRFTWGFSSPLVGGALAAVAPQAAVNLMPINRTTGEGLYPDDSITTHEGYYIPYSLVVTDVYGTCTNKGASAGTYDPIRGDVINGGTTGLKFGTSPGTYDPPPWTGQVVLFISEIPSATTNFQVGYSPSGATAKTQQYIEGSTGQYPSGPTGAINSLVTTVASGVQNFPLVLLPDSSGVIRWNGSSMSNDGTWVPNPSKFPTVYLPADYKKLGPYHPAGFPWQLSAVYVNTNDANSGHANQAVKINLTVEVALVHNPEDQHYSMMGGAVSKGRSWWSVPSAYNPRLARVSDIGIDTTILREWVSPVLNDPSNNAQRLGIFTIPGPPVTPWAVPPYGFTESGLGAVDPKLTINSWLQQEAATTIRIIMNAADATNTPSITVYGADITGAAVQKTVVVAGVTTDIDTPAANKWSRVDGIFTSVVPAHADGFTICPTSTPADIFGKLLTGRSWWGVWSVNSANGGIVHQGRSPAVASVHAIEANTYSPKNQFRRIPIWGNVGATLTHTAGRLQIQSGFSDLWKTTSNWFTATTALNSIKYIGVTDWPVMTQDLLGSPTLFALHDRTTHLEPPWPVGLKAMCAVFDPADVGLVVNVTGFDTGGSAVTNQPVTVTLWDPNNAVPTWNLGASNLSEITGITWATRAPYGEWLLGNFAVPWRDETVSASDSNTGVYIAYGSILY